MSVLTRSDERIAMPVLPRVNLLPPEIAVRRRLRRVQLGLAGGVVATVGVVGVGYLLAVGGVDGAQQQVVAAQADNTVLQRQVQQFNGVRQTYARADAAAAQLTTAMGSEIQWSSFLNNLSLTIPSNVWLTQMTATETGQAAAAPGSTAAAGGLGTINFSGTAFSHDDVAAWLDSLAGQKAYTNPYFSNSTEALIGSRMTVNFTSTVTLTPDALSQRYTQEGTP